MNLVAQSNEWITRPGTMGRSQSDLPTGKTDAEAIKSRRTNSLTFDGESDTDPNNNKNQQQTTNKSQQVKRRVSNIAYEL